MPTTENIYKTNETLYKKLSTLESPILIVSTKVGRGNYSIGEAIIELYPKKENIHHMPIEEMLPPNAVNEDLHRYKFISNNLTFLLHLIYRAPVFYLRKYLREVFFKSINLSMIKNILNTLKIKTVICVSHRPAFWLTSLKTRENLNFKCFGIQTEFGRTLGWKYIFWEAVDGFISPLEKQDFDYDFHSGLEYLKTELPVRKQFYEIRDLKGDPTKVLIAAGFWGQISFHKIQNLLKLLLNKFPEISILIICGTNTKLFNKLKSFCHNDKRIRIFGEIKKTSDLIRECACIITKPGMSTILEAHTSQRKLFLLKGMPVAEDHNAQYAIDNYNAQWFNLDNFTKWYNCNIEK